MYAPYRVISGGGSSNKLPRIYPLPRADTGRNILVLDSNVLLVVGGGAVDVKTTSIY